MQSTTVELPILVRSLQDIDFPHKLGIMDRLFGRQLAAEGIVWVRTAARIVWKLDLSYAPSRWIVYGKYEGAPFLDWAKRFLRRDAVVVDAGANIGQMLLYFAQWVPEGLVLAFEPGGRQAAWLSECLERHPGLPVAMMRAGLGARAGAARLLESGPPNVHGAWNRISESDGEEIRLVRLTDVIADRGITQVDLWKLDVEGFELEALKGAEELLSEQRVRALYVELAGDDAPRVVQYLERLGYGCFLFRRDGSLAPLDSLPPHTNGLFLPPAVQRR